MRLLPTGRAASLLRVPRARRSQLPSHAWRTNSTQAGGHAAPAPQPDIYKILGRPFAKVFLGAMLTYQIMYWGWEKLRIDEIKGEKLEEIAELEKEIEGYKQKQKHKA